MGLGDLVNGDDENEEEKEGESAIDVVERLEEEMEKEEEEEELDTFNLPLLVMVEIDAESFADAVKQLREKYEPRLSGLLLKRASYMEAEIPEDINRYRDD